MTTDEEEWEEVPEETLRQQERLRRNAQLVHENSVAWSLVYRPCISMFDGTIAPFVPMPNQEKTMLASMVPGMTLINKARQLGFSTGEMMNATWALCEHPNILIPALSRNQEGARELMRIFRVAYETAEMPHKPRIIVDNLDEIELSNRSRIKALPASVSTARGLTGYKVILDEFGLIDPPSLQKEIWTAAWPSARLSGNLTLMSTPHGVGNTFADLWQKLTVPEWTPKLQGRVDRSDNEWRCFCWPWWTDPRLPEDFAERMYANGMSREQFGQEYNCEFVGGSEFAFRGDQVEACVGGFPPGEGILYTGCDVAGRGRAESVIVTLGAPPYIEGQSAVRPAVTVCAPRRFANIPIGDLAYLLDHTPSQEVGVDGTGVGYPLHEQMTTHHTVVVFTGGRNATRKPEDAFGNERWSVGRERLIANARGLVERKLVGFDRTRDADLILAVKTARWEKGQGQMVDVLDAWLIACWMMTGTVETVTETDMRSLIPLPNWG